MIAAIAPTAAQADTTPLTIGSIFCETGRNQYFCRVPVSGGVGPVTTTWSPAASGSCTGNTLVRVTVVATDSTGVSVSRSKALLLQQRRLALIPSTPP